MKGTGGWGQMKLRVFSWEKMVVLSIDEIGHVVDKHMDAGTPALVCNDGRQDVCPDIAATAVQQTAGV